MRYALRAENREYLILAVFGKDFRETRNFNRNVKYQHGEEGMTFREQEHSKMTNHINSLYDP